MNVIEVQNFSKKFGRKVVLEDLSFEVKQGEIMAFLGANGSGKTTTIRALFGIYQPTNGNVSIFGGRYQQSMASKIGYLPEERGIYLDAPVLETIAYFGELKGVESKLARERAAAYLEKVGLADKAKEKIKKLSSGQQQKIQLGICLINDPELLVLDEPTKGLDPVNRQLFMDMFLELNKTQGTTILFSTHQMEEVEKVANRLVMINDKKRVLYGSVGEVRRSFGENAVHLDFAGKLPAQMEHAQIKSKETNAAELELNKDSELNDLIQELLKSDVKINRIELATPSLQQIFMQISNSNE